LQPAKSSIAIFGFAPVRDTPSAPLALIFPNAANAATKANRRQDEQDLQDGFCLRLTGTIDSFKLDPSSFFILSILFILSKNASSRLFAFLQQDVISAPLDLNAKAQLEHADKGLRVVGPK